MTTAFEISDRLTESYAELSPMAATFAGVKGHDHLWDDLSPDGEAAKADFYGAGIDELRAHVEDPDPVQAAAARVVSSHLGSELRRYESGHWRRDLNHIHSPFQSARDTFDVVPKDSPAAWDAVTARLKARVKKDEKDPAGEELAKAGRDLRRKLDEVEKRLWQPEGTKGIQPETDAENRLDYAMRAIGSSYDAPTPAHLAYLERAEKEAREALDAFNQLFSQDVATFRAKVRELGVQLLPETQPISIDGAGAQE